MRVLTFARPIFRDGHTQKGSPQREDRGRTKSANSSSSDGAPWLRALEGLYCEVGPFGKVRRFKMCKVFTGVSSQGTGQAIPFDQYDEKTTTATPRTLSFRVCAGVEA